MKDRELNLVDIALYKKLKSVELPEGLERELDNIAEKLEEIGLSFYRTCNGTIILTLKAWEIHFVPDEIGIKEYIYERSGHE